MKPVLIIKNNVHEGPGLIEDILKEKQLAYEIRELDKGESFPDPCAYSAVVVMGGPDSANDETPKMHQEVIRVEQVINQDIPYLGICLGMQVLCKAAGGKVMKSPFKEVCFKHEGKTPYEVEVVQDDPIFTGIGKKFRVFHLHGETIEPNQWVSVIGKGNFIKPQIIKVGSKAYGTQCHFELTAKLMNEWLDGDVDPDLNKDQWNQLMLDWQEIEAEYLETGRRLIHNFFMIAGL